MTGTTHKNARFHQLCIVLVGGDHVHFESGLTPLHGQCAYHIVGLVARHFENGYVVGAYDVLDNGHGPLYVFGRCLALGFVGGVGFVAEGATGGVEGNADEIGLFGVQYIVECVDKTIHGRGVLAFGVDARRAYQCIVSAVYERVGVEQIEGLHSLYIVIMLTKVRKYSRTIS